MNEELNTKLRHLRLSGFVEALPIRNQQAVHNNLAHVEFLELLVEDELTRRRDRLHVRRRCRMISCPAANGIRCVKPSVATVSPSWTRVAMASARNSGSPCLLPFRLWVARTTVLMTNITTKSVKTEADRVRAHRPSPRPSPSP